MMPPKPLVVTANPATLDHPDPDPLTSHDTHVAVPTPPGHVPPIMRKQLAPAPASVDELDHITLTQAKLQAIIQAHISQSVPDTPTELMPPQPHVAAAMSLPGVVTYEGGLAPRQHPLKHCHYYLAKVNSTYETIDPNAIMVPMKIIHALEQGMPQYIPLSILTTKVCWEAVHLDSLECSSQQSLLLQQGRACSFVIRISFFLNTSCVCQLISADGQNCFVPVPQSPHITTMIIILSVSFFVFTR
jgi:hypothetical protein